MSCRWITYWSRRPGIDLHFIKDVTKMTDRPQNANLRPIQPGEVRNPNGRPKGSRNKLGEDFVKALHEDFTEHGVSVIARVRSEEPAQYLKVVAGLLPKEVKLERTELGDLSEDEIIAAVDALRTFLAKPEQSAKLLQ
jgi:hypothetical protein